MKSQYIKRIALLSTAIVFLFSCKKKFDDYYAPPANLEPAIYQQLEKRGSFTKFLALIDKAGYKQTLGAAGYWTIFAPTDSAFQADADFTTYLQGRGIASFEAIDSATAQSLVQYLLVFNAFEKSRIDDYQSNLGWVSNQAFKRRTAYYTGFYKDTVPTTGQEVTAIASNRNNTGAANSYYNASDNNNKYLPFFTTEYFATKGLTSGDYQFFYPGTTFTGFNVAGAAVTEKDIAAQNGVIHVINKVITPLHSLDQYIRTKPEYSLFRSLMDRFMVQFVQNADATRKYQVLKGGSDNVLVKVYSNLLAFSPNNENYFKMQDNDGQRDGWTLFAPVNDSLSKYINTVLLENYPSVSFLPVNVMADLINAHMWQSTVWPSKFQSTYNYLGEPAYMTSANILDGKMLSNGVFYGTNKVNEPNVFSTVYGKAYLNPKYSLMTRLLDMELRNIITNPSAKYTVFMMSDAVLAAQGYGFNQATNLFTFNGNGNDSNRLNLLRILNTSVAETPNNELANLGQAGFSGIIGTYGGEYIRYNGNQIITAGTRDRNLVATIDSIKTSKNGRVVYLNNLLYFTYASVGSHLSSLGTATTSEYNLFWSYLRNSTAYDAVAQNIIGVNQGSFYTIFAPNNTAIRAAISAGLLPGTSAVPNTNPTATADKILVEKFIQYHILDKRSVASDGKEIGSFATLLKNSSGDPLTVTVQYPQGVFEITDNAGRKANLVAAQSNYLSNRTVIHLLNNYLKY